MARTIAASPSTIACARRTGASSRPATSVLRTSSRTRPTPWRASSFRTRCFTGAGASARLVIPWATYTFPEVAHVGPTRLTRRAAGAETVTVQLRRRRSRRHRRRGRRVSADPSPRGRILAATLVAPARRRTDRPGRVADAARRVACRIFRPRCFRIRRWPKSCGKPATRTAARGLTPRAKALLQTYFALIGDAFDRRIAADDMMSGNGQSGGLDVPRAGGRHGAIRMAARPSIARRLVERSTRSCSSEAQARAAEFDLAGAVTFLSAAVNAVISPRMLPRCTSAASSMRERRRDRAAVPTASLPVRQAIAWLEIVAKGRPGPPRSRG